MACLDSDLLIALFRGNEQARKKILQLLSSGEQLSITPITASELFVGAFASTRFNSIELLETALRSLHFLDFDFFAAKKAGEVINSLKSKGSLIGDMDSLNAAIAMRHNERIITKNTKHYKKIKELKAEGW